MYINTHTHTQHLAVLLNYQLTNAHLRLINRPHVYKHMVDKGNKIFCNPIRMGHCLTSRFWK